MYENSEEKYYIPICKETGCDGVLSIKLNEKDFTVDYECHKNKNHNGQKIFFKTFERFYLKEKMFLICSLCGISLENDIIYNCKTCENKFCSNCFTFDLHITKSINNLSQISKRCKKHNRELDSYCIECDKKLCVHCIKNNDEESNSHKNHTIKYIYDVILSNNQIKSIKNKIKKKSDYINNLIRSIDEIERKLISKINYLKQTLKNEVDLLTKIYLNYNQYFYNYFYYSNFINFLNEFDDSINNVFLKKFNDLETIEEKIENLMNVIIYKEKTSVEDKDYFLEKMPQVESGIFSKINDTFFFNFSDQTYTAELQRYKKEENDIYYLPRSRIKMKSKIESVSVSTKSNRIYACLSYRKIIKIFEYNLQKKAMKLCEEEINDEDNQSNQSIRFNKCIELIDDYVATSDSNNICIWKKDSHSLLYSNIKKMYLNEEINDLLLIDDNYFISSSSDEKIINFFNMENMEIEKILCDIDSINSNNCLFLLKDYVIIDCIEGIAILYTKTKELVQYIKNFCRYKKGKTIYTGNNNNIYIFDRRFSNFNIINMKFFEGSFIPIKEYKNIKIKNNYFITNYRDCQMICINKDDIIIYDKENVFILKEEEKRNENESEYSNIKESSSDEEESSLSS